MLKLNKCVLGIFFLLNFVAPFAHAEAPSDTLTNLLLNIHTMQANFTQTVTDKSAKAIQQTQGAIALERPGKFRWEVKKPSTQLIIANGTRLWIYDPDLEQVTIRNFSKAAGQTPALLLSDKNLTLGKDFNVILAPNPSQLAGSEIFLLTPKDKESMFALIKLSFLKKAIQVMQLQDHLGHTTTTRFNNVKVGMPLSPSLFTFKAPPHVDVIDETQNKT